MLVGPKLGEGAAVIDMGEKVLVIHVDPITGATENVGWLAVNTPSFLFTTLHETPIEIELLSHNFHSSLHQK